MNSTPRASVSSGLRWWHCFGAWGLLTVLWSFSIGIGGSPDEPTHIIKAVAVADGQLNTRAGWEDLGGGVSVPRTRVRTAAAYQRLYVGPGCWYSDLDVPSDCDEFPTTAHSRRTVDAFTYVGTYPPTYYLAVGWPSRFLPPHSSIYPMRVVSALLAAAFLAEGTFLLLRRRTDPWLLGATALAIPPSVLLMSSSINPNGLEVAAAFCLWSAGIVLSRGSPGERRAVVTAAVAAVMLAWIRPLGPAYTLIVLLIVFGTLIPVSALRALSARRASRIAGASVALAALGAIAFGIVNHSYSSLITYQKSADRSAATAAVDALGDLGEYLQRAWGLLGPQGYDTLIIPSWILVPWFALVAILLIGALLKGTWRHRIGLTILTLGCVLGPIVPSVVSRGTPWQGRYMLPLLIGVPLLSGAVLARSGVVVSRRMARAIPLGLIGFCSIAYLVAHQHLMNRTAVGLPARPLANLTADSWAGPVSPPVLFVWAVAASACWAAMMSVAIRPSTRPTPLHEDAELPQLESSEADETPTAPQG